MAVSSLGDSRIEVLIGDAAWRAARVDAAAGLDPVVLGGCGAERPWATLATWLAQHAAVVDGLEATHAGALLRTSSGSTGADHLGAGEDLRGLLVALAAGGRPIVVPDAHLADPATAGALSHACALAADDGLSVLITQAPGLDGVVGLPADVQPGGPSGPCGAPKEVRAAAVEDDAPALWRARAHESAGAWAAAASAWVAAGRPDRARRAVAHAPDDPRSIEVAARVSLLTDSRSRAAATVARAAAALEPVAPTVASRLRLRLVLGDLHRADRGAVDRTIEAVDRSLPADAPERTLLAVASAMPVAIDGSPDELAAAVDLGLDDLRAAERGDHAVDVDLVAMLDAAAMVLTWCGSLDSARSLLDELLTVLERRRVLVPAGGPLATSAWLARRCGEHHRAITDGHRAIAVARSAGAVNDVRFGLLEVTHVEAVLGRLDDCREHVAELIPPGTRARGLIQIGAASALGVAELLAGNPDRAVEVLAPVHEDHARTVGPAQVAYRHNLIEAYAELGRLDDAQTVLDDLSRWVSATSAPRERGQLARSRALLAPPDEADVLFAEAIELLRPYPALRWRTEHLRAARLFADGRRAEAEVAATRLVEEARGAGSLAGLQSVQRLLRRHGIAAQAEAPSHDLLSVEHLRVALRVADGADDVAIAAELRLRPADVGRIRRHVLDVLAIDHADELSDRLGAARRPPVLEVRVLGPIAVIGPDGLRTPTAGRPAALLAFVAVHGAVHVEQALDLLWPDDSVDVARPRLRNVLSRLRASVGEVVVRRDERLLLASGVEVDARRFESLAASVRRDGAVDDEALSAAIACWTGPPLPGFLYEEWTAGFRARMTETARSLLELRADRLEAEGRLLEVPSVLEQALELAPYERRLWMRAVTAAEAAGRDEHARRLRMRADRAFDESPPTRQPRER